MTSPRPRRGWLWWRLEEPILRCLAAGAAAGGVVFLLLPGVWHESALADALPPWGERAWALMLATGGLLALRRTDSRLEVTGLLILAACYASYLYALLLTRPFGTTVVAIPVFAALTVGCVLRALMLRFEPRGAPWRQRD